MRIVLVSSGHMALQFAQELSRDNDVSVIHQGQEGKGDLERLDVELLEGTGNDPKALGRARAPEADYLIACARSDEMNILSCLAARQLGPAKTICFVDKEEYVRTFGAWGGAGTGGAPSLGIDFLVWPARMLADKIEKILAVPGATDVGRFAKGQVALLEYRLRDGNPLVGRPLNEIRALPPGVLMVGVTRGDHWFVPRGQSVLQPGDRVSFVGRSPSMHQLAEWFMDQLGEAGRGEIVIIGGGTVGLELARSMERNPKVRLKLIEQSMERCAEIAQVLQQTLVLNGDGCDLDLLEAERVFEARALVAVTDSDEKNLLASLLGRQLGIPKIVTRVSSAANRRLFERVGIDVPLSARGAATEAVIHMVRHTEADLLATIGEGRGELLDISLPASFVPKPLKEVPLPPESIMAALFRKDEALVPGGATLLAPGDHCFVICHVEAVTGVLKALLG
jgi:trk system potassium uptake protein TrkA